MNNEILTPKMREKIIANYEAQDKIIEEQSEYIEYLRKRLNLAEKVCYSAQLYIRSINSPLAVGWDMLLDALRKWKDEKEIGR